MEKWWLNGTSEFLEIERSWLYFEESITLYSYNNNTLSFVFETLVPINVPFVTQNTHIDTTEMKNGNLVASTNPCDFIHCDSNTLCREHHFLNLQQRQLKFSHLDFGTNKTTICYPEYIHAYTSEMKKMVY